MNCSGKEKVAYALELDASMLICGYGAYPRVQPATAEQTSRQQITSSWITPYTINLRPKKKYVCLPSATDRKMPKNLGRDFFLFFFSSKTLNMKTHHFRRKMYNLAVKSFTFSSMKCVSLWNKWPRSFIKPCTSRYSR